MAHRSGLLQLVTDVRSYFTGLAAGTSVVFGWKEPPKQLNQGTGGANRVCLIPGDEGGDGGSFLAARNVGDTRVSRAIVDINRIVTASCWAVDTTNAEDLSAQMEALETLVEQFIQAVQSSPAGCANVEWGALRYVSPLAERRFGAEARLTFTMRHGFMSADRDIAVPNPSVSRDPEE